MYTRGAGGGELAGVISRLMGSCYLGIIDIQFQIFSKISKLLYKKITLTFFAPAHPFSWMGINRDWELVVSACNAAIPGCCIQWHGNCKPRGGYGNCSARFLHVTKLA